MAEFAPPPTQPQSEPTGRAALAQLPTEAGNEVGRLVRRARARARWLVHSTAAASIAAAFLAVLPALLAFASTGHVLARPTFVLALVSCAAAWVWLGPWRAHTTVAGDDDAARLVASRVPSLRRDLLSAVQLGRELVRGPPAALFSPALARAHIETTARAAADVDLTGALPDRSAVRAVFALLTSLAVFAICAVAAPDVLFRGARSLALGSADRDAASGASRTEPITGEVELTYVYPAYTRLETRTVPGTNGEVAAPAGTEVRLRTRADREVARADLVVGNAATALAVQGRDLSGSFMVTGPGSYQFRFFDRRGRLLVDGPPVPIAVEKDEAPRVTLLAPPPELEVDPRGRVTLRYETEDDYGLSSTALVYKLPGAKEPVRLSLAGQSPSRRVRADHPWEIASLGLMPGDRVSYYVEAKDNDAVAGPKVGVSRSQTFKIFSEAEHHRLALKRIEEQWERLVAHLGDRLEAPDRAKEKDTAKVSEGTRVDDRGASIASELVALGTLLRREKAPAELARAASAVGTTLGDSTARVSEARHRYLFSARANRDESHASRGLTDAVTANIAEVERDVLYLESLLDQRRVKDLVALTKELAARRRDLASLLEQYKSAPDAATRARIEAEIARLKERIADLLSRMAELSKGIQDEHLNAEALAQIARERDLLSALDRVQDLLNKGDIDKALAELQKLGQQLDAMQDALARAQKNHAGDAAFSELGRQVAQFAKDLERLTGDQETLARRAQDVRAAYKKALQEKLARKGADFAERLRQKVEKARQKMGEFPQGLAEEETLKRTDSSLSTLEQALKVKDYDEAREAAAEAQAYLRSLSERVERQAQYLERDTFQLWPDPAMVRRGQRATRGATPLVREVKEELDNLFPAGREPLSAEQMQAMRGMSQEQQGLRGRASDLGKQMGEISRQAPVFPPGAHQQMQQAGESMGRASDRLQDGNSGGAVSDQRAALDHLRQLQKALDEAMRQGGGPGSIPVPLGEPDDELDSFDGDRMSMQKVVIPGADQYQVPEEFRKDILDAMRNAAPEKYRGQVKKYYEEIVR